jgi:hypothetical protein
VNVREGQRVDTRVNAPDELSGAVEKGERLGRVTVTVDGEPAGSSPLVAGHAVGAATTVDKAISSAQNSLVLIGLAAIVILVGLLLMFRGRGSQRADDPGPEAQDLQRIPPQRTPEERRRMHDERMRRRRQRIEREGGAG